MESNYLMPLTCSQLLQNHPALWQDATVHPFLTQCCSGEIQAQQFNTWLLQDYLFVLDFTRMAARLLAAAPVHHFDILLGGLVALKDELTWFQVKAAERGLELPTDLLAAKQPTCMEYCEYIASLSDAAYSVQATAFWAIELAYNQGWQLPGSMVPPYDEFANRWGNAGFTEYVKQLEQQANQDLELASEEVQQQAKRAFLEIVRHEKAFWQMAYGE